MIPLNVNDRIFELGMSVKRGEITWRDCADYINDEFGLNLSRDSVRSRFRSRENRIYKDERNDDTSASSGGMSMNNSGNTFDRSKGDYTTEYADGVIEAQRIVEYNREVFGDKCKMLEYLGYSPEEWEFVFVTTSVWQQHTKEQTTKELYAVKFKVRPLVKSMNVEKALDVAKEVFADKIDPLKVKARKDIQGLDKNKLLFIPQIEAHLGKLSEKIDTGVEYNHKIVEERVRKVFEEVILLQEREKCDRCLLVVGGDFFNSESNSQTTSGTLQQNDVRFKEMFNIGLCLYLEGLITLRENFNHVDVKICAGNHSRAMEHFLYIALSCYFRDDEVIKFSDDYKDTQSYVFGDVGLFFNHGDANQKRLIASIPAEFYQEYGKTLYRYLFVGHLHKLEVVNAENGLTLHRVPAICENDDWHYQNRFGVGNVPQHEIMIFDKNYGMLSDNFVYFGGKSRKNLTKVKKNGNI